MPLAFARCYAPHMLERTSLAARMDINRIVQGEAIVLTVEVYDRISGVLADFATSAPSTVTAEFVGTSAPVEKTLGSGVAVDSNPGRLTVTLSASDTQALKLGDEQNWQLSYTIGSVTRIVQPDDLDVVASLF